jgi:hypothetical protein
LVVTLTGIKDAVWVYATASLASTNDYVVTITSNTPDSF